MDYFGIDREREREKERDVQNAFSVVQTGYSGTII